MRISESWLREWTDPPLPLEEIAEILTGAGLELEEIHIPAVLSKDIVVATLVNVSPHPQADRLRICEVTDGKESYSVVCGAENARKNLKSAFAKVGTRLPNGTAIKVAKLRGVKSEGMLCSEKELQIGEDAAGIMELPADAPVGKVLADYLGSDDKVMELAVTPNRGDCFCLRGIAREVSVLCNAALRLPTETGGKETLLMPQHRESVPVELLSPKECPAYYGCVIKEIDLGMPTPEWMKRRLLAAGLRPLDLAVDVTNYVMLELGQPLHAFDLRTIKEGIRVRRGDGKQKLKLLTGEVILPDAEDLVIADHTGPVALAGVIGGRDTAIGENTKDIFLEGAFFTPEIIFGKQAKYGLQTDAAHRFERGVDYGNTENAMSRAVALLAEYGNGKAGPIVGTLSRENLPRRESIRINSERLNIFLGLASASCVTEDALSETNIIEILEKLGMQVKVAREEVRGNKTAAAKQKEVSKESAISRTLGVTPPSHRFDLDCWESLAEELARVYGYDKIPAHIPKVAFSENFPVSPFLAEDRARSVLAGRGYRETVNYSFIGAEDIARSPSSEQPLEIANPISQAMSMMRSDLLPGLLRCLFYNYRQRPVSRRIFEIGMCFVPGKNPSDNLLQETRIGGAILDVPEGRPFGDKPCDFWTLKSDMQALLRSCGADANFSYDTPPPSCVHPGCFLSLTRPGDGMPVGYAGQLHPSLREKHKLGKASIYVFEFTIDILHGEKMTAGNAGSTGNYAPFSRYPIAQFELSLVMDKEINYYQLKGYIQKLADRQLQSVELLDVYTSPKLGENKKSMSIRLGWQSPTETLTDDYTGKQADKLLKQLAQQHNIVLRAE